MQGITPVPKNIQSKQGSQMENAGYNNNNNNNNTKGD